MADTATLSSAFTILAISLAALVLSGRWIIRLLSHVTTAFGISEFSVAFIFLAIATSIPELFVAISSAHDNAGDIVLAVALGSNVVNMTLIVGLASILTFGISTKGLNLRRDIGVGIIINLLPILFLLNGVISRFEGLILIGAFIFYISLLWRDRQTMSVRKFPKRILRGVSSLCVLLLLIGLLIFAADKTVSSSVEIATILRLPSFLIGLFILAVGTSLPELTTTLQSAYQRKPTLALGNILGSNVADAALIVGTASLVRPLQVTINSSLILTCITVIFVLSLMGYFAFSRQKISFSEGLLLLLLFIIFSLALLATAPTSFL